MNEVYENNSNTKQRWYFILNSGNTCKEDYRK